jgi:serine O-acetyltransferase
MAESGSSTPDPAGVTPLESELSLWDLIRADIKAANPNLRHLTGRAFWVRALGKAVVAGSVRVVVIYRLSHVLARRGQIPLAMVLRAWGVRTSGAEINPQADIGPGLYVAHAVGVGVGAYATIGRNCRIHLGALIGPQPHPAQPQPLRTVIGDDVYIGSHAVIMGGVTIGRGATIGANAVVLRDVEPFAVVAAPPGRVVAKREPDDPRI